MYLPNIQCVCILLYCNGNIGRANSQARWYRCLVDCTAAYIPNSCKSHQVFQNCNDCILLLDRHGHQVTPCHLHSDNTNHGFHFLAYIARCVRHKSWLARQVLSNTIRMSDVQLLVVRHSKALQLHELKKPCCVLSLGCCNTLAGLLYTLHHLEIAAVMTAAAK